MFFFVICLPHIQKLGVFRASPQFLTKRRRLAVIAFLGGFPPNILALPPKTPLWQTFQCKNYYRESAPLVPG